ncbi:MobF family relaxase [Frigoriglobus tundricola]|uniref:TrwC relaxase domain-containing protein n=1 Tax=Frigoriglobus tundricola TaxID=2774151 RepID=A0A6M5YMZ1_9BACT|nr:MobF family relaxase [Frigoriglobus tundricola]QJW95417.1 hypothetical protein FTUN_2966 [Frigoriglobus tundricola]
MLRIHQSASAGQAKQYYTQALDRTDYYTREGEQPGLWFGRGAARLGLAGEVERDDFFALLDNRQPGTGQRLTARDKGDARRPGWDLVFSPPKSVSVLRALNGDERIAAALLESAQETLRDIEDTAIATRLRRGGQQGTEPVGNLVASLFTHDTTRALADGAPDPHDHIHAYIHNAAWVEREQRWQAIDTHAVHIDRPYYEAAFEARLAKRLTALGYGIERHVSGWEVAGVPQTAIDKMSRRTTEIEAEAERRGITSAAEKAQLGAKTRRAKGEPVPRVALRDYWLAKLTTDERLAIAATFQRTQVAGEPLREPTPEQALTHAADHLFERESTVPVTTLMTAALKFGVGAVTPEALREQLPHQGLLTAEADGRWRATAAEVLAEEQVMLRFCRDGRGVCDPLGGYAPHQFSRDDLNSGQTRAISALLNSFDQVQILRGLAGVGKSTALGEVRTAIEAQGRTVLAVAPSTGARDVLREDGFQAETVAMLLASTALQQRLADGGVLLVDEAGMVGSRDMARLCAVAERHGARVILSGDSAQHRSPARGAALRLLEERGGIKPAGLSEILRQTGKLKEAIAALASGRGDEGFDRLDALGAIREIAAPDERYQLLARDYADALAQGKETLAIAPTHLEGSAVTAAIRTELKSRGRIGTDEHHLLRLENSNLTEAQRRDAVQYQTGDVVQFVQNVAGGWRKGERVTVVGHNDTGVRVRTATGQERALPLAAAERFQLYRARELAVATGDRIRVTLGGSTRDAKRLANGRVATIAGFTSGGDLRLDNGWVVAKEYGHLAAGWAVTSHAAQGKTVKGRVFVAQSKASLAASNLPQFYVSASRAKGGPGAVAIYTDDKEALRRAVSRDDRSLSATELLEPRSSAKGVWARVREQVRRLHYQAKVYARLGLDHLQERLITHDQYAYRR